MILGCLNSLCGSLTNLTSFGLWALLHFWEDPLKYSDCVKHSVVCKVKPRQNPYRWYVAITVCTRIAIILVIKV